MKKPNHLIAETSPYLLQHAYNPVQWYPWGEEAIEKAKLENKPMLVSIGYAACHWCHVMEKESFENEEIAAIMNEHFVNIKIDREERPDLDQVYMDAVQAMTGSGGWPLNVFLFPDGRPFYGGTYFPPKAIYNKPSWADVLYSIANAYHNKKDEINQQAQGLTDYIKQSNAFGVGNNAHENFTDEKAMAIFENMMKLADLHDGGFGKAPKFPQTFSIQYLIRYYHFYKDENALAHATLSLKRMIYGGIYDQLGGGFARYATDTEWLVPHFEKMLYDNALLIIAMSEAYQLTKDPVYFDAINHTIEFVQRELLSPENGFYAALDADSEGEEGKFYVWSKKEIDNGLENDTDLFCRFYGITEAGNWEGKNILHIQEPLHDFAEKHSLNELQLKEQFENSRRKLWKTREQRIRPALDDKILLSWNALMNTALCKAFAATGNDNYKTAAIANMHLLLSAFVTGDGQLFHTYKNKQAKIPAFLDDYAFLIQALIFLQEITGDHFYLLKAKELSEHVIAHFSDEENIFFYYTSKLQKDIIVRKKEVYDGAIPSANAVMTGNLHYLAIVFDLGDLKQRAIKTIYSLEKICVNYPNSFGIWCNFILEIIKGTHEIVLTGMDLNDMRKDFLSNFIPFRVFQSASHEMNGFPLLSGKTIMSQPLLFHCENYTCSKPVSNVELLRKLL